jgi:hypothetical protein
VSGLGHILETAGLSTVSISLVREHSERIAPPRALWVPFEFGRPFGVPGDAEFQSRVLLAALGLLQIKSGPVLADYPEDAPGSGSAGDGEGWVCPVNLKPVPTDAAGDAVLAAMLDEIEELRPWYDLGLERRGSTTLGASGMDIVACARYLGAFTHGSQTTSDLPTDLRSADVLKLSLMDVKTFYLESALARPGAAASRDLEEWFWGGTAAARMFLVLQRACINSEDEFIALLGKQFIVPRAQAHRLI